MCITKVESFQFAGKLYAKETDAIAAAVNEIGERIKKDHHANPASGIFASRDELIKLLVRHRRLSRHATATEVTSENGTGEPKRGTEA